MRWARFRVTGAVSSWRKRFTPSSPRRATSSLSAANWSPYSAPGRAIRLAPKIQSAKAFKNLADVQQITGKLPESLESVRQSLKISEDQLSKDPRQQQFQIDVQQA